jgi:hypothetical protein
MCNFVWKRMRQNDNEASLRHITHHCSLLDFFLSYQLACPLIRHSLIASMVMRITSYSTFYNTKRKEDVIGKEKPWVSRAPVLFTANHSTLVYLWLT